MFKRVGWNELIRVMSLMKSRLWVYIPSTVINNTLVSIFLNIILAFILKSVLDAVTSGDAVLMQHGLWLAISAFVVGCPSICIFGYVINWCVKKTVTDIRMRAFSHILALPMSCCEQRHSGDLISRMTNDLDTMSDIFAQRIQDLIFAVVHGLIAMGAIFILDWRFGTIVSLLGFSTVLVNTLFAKPLRQISDMIQERTGALTERLMDLLHGLSVTKMFHIEQTIHQRYVSENEAMSTATIRRSQLDGALGVCNYLIENLRRIGLLALGLLLILKGDPIEVGTIAAIIHLQGNAEVLFSSLGNFLTSIQSALAGAGRVFELQDISTEPEQYAAFDISITVSPEFAPRMVEMKNLTFGYAENGTVLHDINISVEAGAVAALVGPSGGGKSTIIKLLLGFYPPNAGNIIINGQSLGAYSLSQLRSLMAYVPQDAYLFDGTIEKNISYGKPAATKAEIIAVSKAANAHDFIVAQPEGYQTRIGERGAKLSGGQRQRIAIARALLKDAPILLLDEATSALDSESEQLVQEALNALMKGRTTIVIAHRLSTIEHADVIYAIDEGKVVEQGKHDELLANRGLYRRLHRLQFRSAEFLNFEEE